jgi:hypothetical protein
MKGGWFGVLQEEGDVGNAEADVLQQGHREFAAHIVEHRAK